MAPAPKEPVAKSTAEAPTESAPPCPNYEGGSCLGPLSADRDYTTSIFHPQLTYSVPDPGWFNFEDTPGNFGLLPPGNDLSGVGPNTADFIGVYTSVAPSQFTGAATCEVQLVPGVQASPQGMVDWMRQQPELSVTDAVRTTVGGLAGLMVDVRARPGAVLPSCVDSGNTVTVFLLFSGKSASVLDHGVVPGMTMRLYMLDYEGGILLIELTDIDAAPVDMANLAAVAEKFQFAD